jgi:hypothetical protein
MMAQAVHNLPLCMSKTCYQKHIFVNFVVFVVNEVMSDANEANKQ